MDKLAAMRAFLEIADQGSLTAAARVLGKSQPTMVRTLANLESELGVRLLRRTTRRLALTEEGQIYLHRARHILAEVTEAELALTATDAIPQGSMRITAPVAFGQWHIAPAITAFLSSYPQVQIDLLLLDRVVNLLEEGIDLAVRIGTLADSSMIATNVGTMRRVVCISPERLKQLGTPDTPAALANQPCVNFYGLSPSHRWTFANKESVSVSGPLTTNQAITAVNACKQGVGFGQFFHYQVAEAVQEGSLQIVLQNHEPAPQPVNLIYTDTRFMTPRLRVLLTFMRKRLRSELGALSAG